MVEVLDAPPSVYSYEPIYVTFEVRNEGDGPVVIPVDRCPVEGASLHYGRSGEELDNETGRLACPSRRLVWLPPGGRWLFFRILGMGAVEGRYQIQAVFRSPGQCWGPPIGPERDRIVAVRPIELGSRPFDCWSGEAKSQRVEVDVQVPRAEVDVAAAEYLELDHVRWKNNWNTAFILGFRDLFRRFPTSHYAYAASSAIGGGGTGMVNVVILQPDNPLNRWAAAAMAQDRAYRNRPCATPWSWRPGASEDLDERIDRVIAAYPPPEPVRAYLRQLDLEYAAEACPEAEGQAAGVASDPVSPEPKR